MHRLQERFSKLIQEVSTDYHRYMYNKIDWNNRMIGLTGPFILPTIVFWTWQTVL